MLRGPTVPLLPDERVVWEGRPFRGLIFQWVDIFLIPFSVVWAGGAAQAVRALWKPDAPFAGKLIGLLFLCGGAYATIGRFLLDAAIRRRMVYAVTNRRVLIRTRGGRSTKSLDVRHLPLLEVEERGDGSGTIRFGNSGGMFGLGGMGTWQPMFDPTPRFIRVPDVHSVHELIRKQADR